MIQQENSCGDAKNPEFIPAQIDKMIIYLSSCPKKKKGLHSSDIYKQLVSSKFYLGNISLYIFVFVIN